MLLPRATTLSLSIWQYFEKGRPRIVQMTQTQPLDWPLLACHNSKQADKITLCKKTLLVTCVLNCGMPDCRTGFKLTSIYMQAGQSTSIDSYKFEAFQSRSSNTNCPTWPFSSCFFSLERANSHHWVQTEGLVVICRTYM